MENKKSKEGWEGNFKNSLSIEDRKTLFKQT